MTAERTVAARDGGKGRGENAGKAVSSSRPTDREEVAARAFAAQTAPDGLACAACRDDGPCAACAGAAASLTRRLGHAAGGGVSGGENVGKTSASAPPRAPVEGAPPLVERALAAPGSALPKALQRHFEQRLGADLSGVRVHDDARADAAARSLRARAFTLGNRIAFAAGAPRPHTTQGQALLGHELAHTVQPGAERVLRRDDLPPGHPALQTPAELIASYTSWGNLDEDALGQRLFELAWMGAGHYAYIGQVMDALDWGDRDDVASGFVRSARDDNLDEFARGEAGRAMLRRLKNELVGGFPSGHEVGEALRLLKAIRSAEGAVEGEKSAGDLMTAAEQRGRSERLRIAIPASLSPAEIDDRLRLASLLLARLRAASADDADLLAAITVVEGQITAQRPALTSLAIDPTVAATRVTLAQEISERGARNLGSLGTLLKNYRARSDLGAAQPAYVALAERVRGHWLAALRAALTDDALEKLSVAEASATALPRALTEVDLGILEKRPQTEGSSGEMVAWVRWIRDRLNVFETEARALATAREQGEANLTDRQSAFEKESRLLQDSIAAVGEWERALRAYEALALGGSLIGKDDFRAIRERCRAMRDAAMAGNAADLHARLERHRNDPAVERFYRAIPAFIGASTMLFGLSVTLVAAMASAGVGALVFGPEVAGMAAAGAVALEALTFTAVSRTLTGIMAPPSRTPLLVELALNIGLFGLLRGMGAGIKTALSARGLGALTGVATHSASYVVLSGWGAVHFRLEQGRWPNGEEIAKMSVDNLIMLAGVAAASGTVVRAIRGRQQLRALENFNARYGLRLATIEIARTRLTNRLRSELAAGRGDDAAVVDALRTEAEDLDTRLHDLIEEAKADSSIGIAELRTALADRAIDAAAVGGDLLSRSLDLPERVGLRRAGGANLYSYEMGATPPLVERLTALGGRVSQSVDASGRRTVVAEFKGDAPLLFVERAVSPELAARLAELARVLDTPNASRADRQGVIGSLRTPHGQAPGELEGFVLDSVLAENQRAFGELIAQLRGENPDAIVGMEQGGAFLADVIAAGDPVLARRVLHMPVHKTPAGEKFDGPKMQAEFQRLIDGGARRIAIVDSYMGGTTAAALRDDVLGPLARRDGNGGVDFHTHWLRETLGFRAGGTMGDLRGQANPRSPGGSQLHSDQRQVRLVLGDDMQIVYTPGSREPITLFDSAGRITRVEYPRPGETTRDVLIRLLLPPAASTAPTTPTTPASPATP
ncbi:MAG TPA: DUF4157 domain-containing protein [Accumulibacter sp.]|jgi:hypothetical protein|nr:DUF4157 domain-containing protein [Accumulibacter sp.]